MLGIKNAKSGIRITGLPVVPGPGNANALPIFQISNLVTQRGTKTFKIKRIKILDIGAGGTLVHIGIGAAGAVVDVMPALRTVNNANLDITEDDIPEVEFAVDAMAYPDAGTVSIQVEVEEIG